jgi:hypothetical protein
MENRSIVLLTNTNYFQWKSHIEGLSRSKGIYKITLGIETAPTNDEAKVAKWASKNYQACGLIGLSISLDLIFHLDGLDSPVKVWEKLNDVFGLKNEI